MAKRTQRQVAWKGQPPNWLHEPLEEGRSQTRRLGMKGCRGFVRWGFSTQDSYFPGSAVRWMPLFSEMLTLIVALPALEYRWVPVTRKLVPGPPGWVILPSLARPAPQLILAVKFEALSAGLTSMKVATTSVNRTARTAMILRPVAINGASATVAVCDGEGRGAAQIMDGDGGAVGPRLGVGVGPGYGEGLVCRVIADGAGRGMAVAPGDRGGEA